MPLAACGSGTAWWHVRRGVGGRRRHVGLQAAGGMEGGAGPAAGGPAAGTAWGHPAAMALLMVSPAFSMVVVGFAPPTMAA